MLGCTEQGGTIPRTIVVTVKPTVTETADAVWHMNAGEQAMLLGCLKRRFCDREEGLLQMAALGKELDTEKSEAKTFIRCLAEYVLMTDELKHLLALWENAVCEIRKENKARENNAWIDSICNKLESSMTAYAKGDVEYAHFAI